MNIIIFGKAEKLRRIYTLIYCKYTPAARRTGVRVK